nr:MAG TPA: tail assembly chaperone protein [Caudoviricetes sp.]
MSLEEVKKKYLQEALGKPIQKYGVDLGGGRFTSLSDAAGFYAESCPEPITAKVEKKYLRFGYVAEEIPIEIVKKPKGFLGNRQLYTFTTPDLKNDNLKVDALDSPLIGKVTVKFKAGQNFAVRTEKISQALYQSSDGCFYTKPNLPEQGDDFCLKRYSAEVKSERNARISDTDKYVQLSDITFQAEAGAKRKGLTDNDRQSLFAYRQALKDLPEKEGFPFVDFPKFPEALNYELEKAAAVRRDLKERGRRC